MKKVIIVVTSFLMIAAFFSCTKLTISNNTSFDLDLIRWIDEDGETYWFGTDRVYDYVLYMYLDGMHPGSSDEQDVDPGNSPIYFWFASGGPEYRTVDWIEVEKRKHEKFTIKDSTLVYEAGISDVKTYRLDKIAQSSQIMTEDSHNKRLETYRETK